MSVRAHVPSVAASDVSLLPPSATGHSQYKAVIVAQVRDCNGNLGHFAFLDRPSVKDILRERYVLLDGAGADTIGVRDRLPDGLRHAELRLLSGAQRRLLVSLGHDATPILAVFDPSDRLLIMSDTPDGPVERTAFVRSITRLLQHDPTR